MIFKNIYKLFLCICLFVGFAGVAHAQTESVVLQLKWKHQFQFAGFYMALEKGFYRDAGLEVEIREMDKNTAMFEHLSEDSGYYAIADTGALLERAKGLPIKALAAIFQYSPLALMVKANSPIQTFSDLKGKRIMMVPNLNTGIALALKHAGLTNQDFENQENSYNLQDLFDDKTDAFSVYTTNQPYKLDELGIAYRLLYPKDEGVEFYGDIIITSDNEINQHSSRVKAFLQASFAGWAYALEHMDETIDVIMDNYNREGSSQHMLRLEAEQTKKAILSDVVQVGYMSERRWKNIAEIYAEQGMLTKNYPVADFLYQPQPKFLDVAEQNQWQILLFLLVIVIGMLVAHAARLKQVVKQKAESLLRSEARFKALFEGNKCVELVVDPDTGEIIEANKAAEKFYGYSHGQLLSMRITDINTLSEDEIRNILLRTKEGDIEGVYQFKHKLADGQIRRVEVYSDTILWGSKKVIYSVIFDITPRWEAKKQAYKFEQAIEHAGQAVMITDKHGVAEYVNPAYIELTGYSFEESVGRMPNVVKDMSEDISVTLADGYVWQRKIRKKKKDGQTYLAMVTLSHIVNEQGEIIHTVILQMDMSEHERLEHQFQQSQKMEAIGTLVGGIAHDFNNMLAGMVGNLYLAKKQLNDQPKVIEKLNNVEQLSYKASEMISQLLTFARKSHINTQPMSLNDLIHEAMNLFQAAIPENISVSYDVCENSVCVNGDATQLHQVLMNLISNAQDALEGVFNPNIQLHLDTFVPDAEFMKEKAYFKQQSYARLCVRDNGMGMSDDVMSALFEPFFTTKEQGKGTGLGLSMVFGAVKTHQGFIEVESQEGEGTTFCIYLPLIDCVGLKQAKVEESDMQEGEGETILLVDDEEHILETGREVLESIGYHVLLAKDGLQAVDVFSEHQDDIDLVLTDLVMPQLGGAEAIKRMQVIKPNLKFIFSSGYDVNEKSQDGVTLQKPYQIDMMAKFIRHKLDE